MDLCLDAIEGPDKDGKQEARVAKALEEVSRLRSKTIKEVRDPVLAALAPCCPQHQQPARLLRVKKSGPNKGRRFYVCRFPRG